LEGNIVKLWKKCGPLFMFSCELASGLCNLYCMCVFCQETPSMEWIRIQQVLFTSGPAAVVWLVHSLVIIIVVIRKCTENNK